MSKNKFLNTFNPSDMQTKICHLITYHAASAKYFMLFALASFVFSCSKDKQFDLDVLSTKTNESPISYVLKGRAISLNGLTYSNTKEFIRVAIKLEKEAKTADTVFATVNTALVADYNQRYNENNQITSSKVFSASNNGIFPVRENASQATDSLYVLLSDATDLKDKAVYLVPVELRAKSGNALKYSVIYFKITIDKGELSARFTGASYRSYVFPSYSFGSLRLNYDRIQRVAIPSEVQFGVTINTPFIYNDVNVSAEYVGDAAAIAYGNKLVPNTSMQLFPPDTYTISTKAATVPKGTFIGADSITVTFRNKEKLLPLTNYVMGVKIKRIIGSQYSVSPSVADSSMAFIRLYSFN